MEPSANDKAAFGAAFAAALKERGMRVTDVAREMDTNHQKLYQWRDGIGSPENRAVLDRLEEILGTNGRLALILFGGPTGAQVAELDERVSRVERLVRDALDEERQAR